MADMEKPNGGMHPKSTYILGVDPNRRGKDETGLVVAERYGLTDKIFLTHMETHNYTKLTETIGRVLYLHSVFNFDKIYVDATGLGSGVCDVLKSKIGGGVVEEVMFTRNSKAEMFYNLKLLMQQKKLFIPDYVHDTNPIIKKLYMQFLSIQYEYNEDSRVPKIFHEANTHDDLVCAAALACLFFNQKKLNKKKYYLTGGVSI